MTRSKNAPTCQGIRKDGAACGSLATGADGLCFWHSPRISPEQRHLAVVKGGLASRAQTLPPDAADVLLTSPESALAALQENASKTRRGELDAKIANSVAYQISVAVKVWETAISAKLNKLEKLVNHATGRRR